MVICPSTSLPLALRLDAGSPFSLSRSRARLSTGVADRQPQQLDHRLIGGEVAAVLGDLAQLVVQRLDAVGGVDDTPEHRREVQEGSESLPGPLPGRHRLGVLDSHVGLGEVGQSLPGGLLVRGGADRP